VAKELEIAKAQHIQAVKMHAMYHSNCLRSVRMLQSEDHPVELKLSQARSNLDLAQKKMDKQIKDIEKIRIIKHGLKLICNCLENYLNL